MNFTARVLHTFGRTSRASLLWEAFGDGEFYGDKKSPPHIDVAATYPADARAVRTTLRAFGDGEFYGDKKSPLHIDVAAPYPADARAVRPSFGQLLAMVNFFGDKKSPLHMNCTPKVRHKIFGLYYV